MLTDNSKSCDSIRAIESYGVRESKSDANGTLPPVSPIHYNTLESTIQYLSEIVAHFIPHINTSIIPQYMLEHIDNDSNTVWKKEQKA